MHESVFQWRASLLPVSLTARIATHESLPIDGSDRSCYDRIRMRHEATSDDPYIECHRRSAWIDAPRAVQLAAIAAPKSVTGVFALQVQATGSEDDTLYLNSELDYRDQRNLTAVILPGAGAKLTELLGNTPDVALEGKRILVTGEARRVQIFFYANGRRTEKYYYQTHVIVWEAEQIQIPTQADATRFSCQRQFELAKTKHLGDTAPYAVIASAGPLEEGKCTIRSLYTAPADKTVYVMRKWVGMSDPSGEQVYVDSRSCPALVSVLRELQRIPTPMLPGPGPALVLSSAVADDYRFWTNSAQVGKVRHEIEFSGDSIARWLQSTYALDACWSEFVPASLLR